MRINSLDDLSYLLGTSKKQLIFVADKKNKDKVYTKFEIDKKDGGKRTIYAPNDSLKRIQRKILKRILYSFDISPSVHGFVREKSIITNALEHVKKNRILRIDIENFFPSINVNMIIATLEKIGFSKGASIMLGLLMTRDGYLPQGAPTSPYISNLVCKRLDYRMKGLAKKKNLSYSRYADDITFSGESINGGTFGPIKTILEEEGFNVNIKKTRVMGTGTKQIVTGLVVNEKAWLGRKRYRILRSYIHKVCSLNLGFYKNHLLGKIAILSKTDFDKYQLLKKRIKSLDQNSCNIIRTSKLAINKEFLMRYQIIELLRALNEKLDSKLFKESEDKIQNIFINCEPDNEHEFNTRIQVLNQWFEGMDISYFERILKKKYGGKRKRSLQCIEDYMKHVGHDCGIIDVWRDIENISAGFKRHDDQQLIEKVKEIIKEKYGNVDYNILWKGILDNFLKSLIEFNKIIDEQKI